MRYIKRLDIFILKSFMPLLAMTFFIVLFIVLMQFLWKYVDDLVGKGLEITVIGELFFYAAVCMVPMSLPLAILLASLMTFGNFGEKFELTAMKASGISLLKVMRPLIVFITLVAIGAFFFQNDVLPRAQVKMWTLLFSMKQKSPEVEIPEGVFYDQIPGYNLFVSERDKNTGMLRNVMIYDVSKGGDNSSIILADSARLAFTKDMQHLYLHLFEGEQFENLKEADGSGSNIPFRRESFFDKEVLIQFDANFNRLDDSQMKKQYVGKNITELRQTIDSVNRRVDSIGKDYSLMLRTQEVIGITPETDYKTNEVKPYIPIKMPQEKVRLADLLENLPPAEAAGVYSSAISRARNVQMDLDFKSLTMADDRKSIRRHEIELIKKFTLSVACLIFFFIGAPLGAIIRKGGIGTPLVISVLLFLVYYIIDNTGYKMSRDGRWNVWFGMWLSSLILTPLGVYVTLKAMNDSSVFDADSYKRFFRRLFMRGEKRHIAAKEVIINEVDPASASKMLHDIMISGQEISSSLNYGLKDYFRFWWPGVNTGIIYEYADSIERTVNYLSDSRSPYIIKELGKMPVVRRSWALNPLGHSNRIVHKTFSWILPVGAIMFLVGLWAVKTTKREVREAVNTAERLLNLISDTPSEEETIAED